MQKLYADLISIKVRPKYLENESQPEKSFFIFSYEINITNHTKVNIQVINRHWIIKDGAMPVREVTGDGIVGQQPIIEPGASHIYSSYCPIRTGYGEMHGFLGVIIGQEKSIVEVPVPPFSLVIPSNLN